MLLDERLHREVLEDALLRLLEPEVVLVEHALGLGDVVRSRPCSSSHGSEMIQSM